jgi:predicted RND superfamily exporter protein
MKIHRSPAIILMEKLLKHRLLALLVLLAVTGLFLSQIGGLNISVDIRDFFVPSDPVVQNNRKFEEIFDNSDFIGVLVESDNIFSRETLELIRKVGKELQENVPLAGTVISVTDLEDLPLGGKSIRFEGDQLVSSRQEINEVRDLYTSIPSIGGTLFSRDLDEAWIIVQLDPYTDQWNQFSVGEQAYNIIQSIDSGSTSLTGTGVPVYAYRKQTEMMMDLIRVLLIGSIVALALSSFILRSFRGVLGVILIILFSVLIVFGFQGMRSTTIDSAFLSVPILLTMGVSIGYTVHITRFFLLYFLKMGKRYEAVLYAIQESGKPVLFTAFTTIAALFSFTFVEIRPIQWVGMTSALAIFSVCVLTLIFYPLLLSFGRDIEPVKNDEKTANFEPFMEKIADFADKKRTPIVIIFIITVILGLWGLTRLEIDFNGVKMMGSRLNHMKDQIHISESDIASGETLEITVEMEPSSFKELKFINSLESLEKDLKKYSLVKDTHSLAEVIKEFNYLRFGRREGTYIIPAKDSLTRGLLLYYERISPETLRSWVDEEYGTARVFVELKEFSSKEIVEIVSQTENLVDKHFSGKANYFVSGSSYQMAIMNQYITGGLIKSVLTATTLIALLLIILFRSLKLGLVAMIPNIYPLIICGAIMGFAGIPMEFVTMTVAPMIMGLAVDDTIHFISHIRKDLMLTEDTGTSIRFAFRTVGTAISETTVILCLTFLVFIVSDINSIRNMGILSAAGMAAAYGADIFITPLLIKYFYRNK